MKLFLLYAELSVQTILSVRISIYIIKGANLFCIITNYRYASVKLPRDNHILLPVYSNVTGEIF